MMKNKSNLVAGKFTYAPTCRTLRGITLIELLTVIGVIGVLAAILIPVVSSVRSRAHASVSTSNLREMAKAHFGYEMDHGHLPSLTDYNESGRSWAQRIAPYLGLTKNSFVPGAQPPGVFYLPGVDNPLVQESWGTHTPYSRNFVFVQTIHHLTRRPQPDGVIFRNSEVRNPAGTILLTEWNQGARWLPREVNFPEYKGFNGGRYAFAFLDGHVESFPAGRVPTQHDRSEPTFREGFWDPRVSILD